MLRWALLFFVIAIVAAVFGFGGIAGDAACVGKVLLFVFLALAIISLLVGRPGRPHPSRSPPRLRPFRPAILQRRGP